MRVALVPELDVNPYQGALCDPFAQQIRTSYSAFKASDSDGALLGPLEYLEGGPYCLLPMTLNAFDVPAEDV